MITMQFAVEYPAGY